MAKRILAASDDSSYSIGNSFDASKRSALDLNIDYVTVFAANVQGLFVKLESIHASTSSLTMKLCTDTAGDEILIPDTQADISTGITTTDKGAAVWKIDLDVYTSAEMYYLFFKTNAGTATISDVQMTYSRDV